MNSRFYLLLEHLQALDAKLRLEQTLAFANRTEIARLQTRKLTVRNRLSRLARRSSMQPI
jgi:hypothetical protein